MSDDIETLEKCKIIKIGFSSTDGYLTVSEKLMVNFIINQSGKPRIYQLELHEFDSLAKFGSESYIVLGLQKGRFSNKIIIKEVVIAR